MEALSLDVRNYDVFNELVNEMMLPEEGESLQYRTIGWCENTDFLNGIAVNRVGLHPIAQLSRAARRRRRRICQAGIHLATKQNPLRQRDRGCSTEVEE